MGSGARSVVLLLMSLVKSSLFSDNHNAWAATRAGPEWVGRTRDRILDDADSKRPAGSLFRLRRNMCSALTAIAGTIERQLNKKTSEEPRTPSDAELLWQIWAQPPKATPSTRLNPLPQTGVLGQILVSVDFVATGCHPLIIADQDWKSERACSPYPTKASIARLIGSGARAKRR